MADIENNIQESIDEENNDIALIDEINMKHQAELEARDKKYAQLQRAYALKIGGYAEASAPTEKTAEELKAEYEDIVRELHTNKLPDIEQGKLLLKFREYRLANNMSDPFLPLDGTPSEDDLDSADKTADLIRNAIETGSDGMYRAYIQEHLVDKIKMNNRR